MNSSFLLQSPEILEGIGPTQAGRLADTRITNVGTMFRAGPAKVHRACTGSGKKQVGNWFCAASLLRIPEVNPDLAELFVRAGIRSLQKVAQTDLASLESALRSADPNRAIDVYLISRIQQSASQRLGQGLFFGRVLLSNGDALAGCSVDIGPADSVTDEQGWFAFDSLAARQYTPVLKLDFWPRPLRLHSVTVSTGRLAGPLVVRVPSRQSAADIRLNEVHEQDGYRIVNTRSTTVVLEDLPLSSFPAETLFELRKTTGKKAHLLNVYLVKRGFTIAVQRTEVAKDTLPAAAVAGAILQWKNGSFTATNLTRSDVNRQKIEAARAKRTRRRSLRINAEPGSEVVRLG